MGRLTTHVLDTANGVPARGVGITLNRLGGDRPVPVASTATNDDGRCDGPLLEGEGLVGGPYELEFRVGEYFAARGLSAPAFLDVVPVRFLVSDPGQHYHVPLLISPYGYSTYRGS